MNKESLRLFLFSFITVILFNTFILSPKYKETTPDSVEKIAEIASIEEFPIATLYKDAEEETFGSYAVQYGNIFIVLQKEDMPSLFYQKKAIYPIYQNKDFYCYSADKNASLALPKIQKNPETLQILENFTEENHLQQKAIFTSEVSSLDKPSLAFVAQDGLWLPFAYFSEESKDLTPLSDLNTPFVIEQVKTEGPSSETFYVLENSHMQVVFSTQGGAISEINLPLKGPSHPNSPINTVTFDRTIANTSPENNIFPLTKAYTADSTGKISTYTPHQGGYTPLLRRSIKQSNGSIQTKIPAGYYAAQTLSTQNHAPTAYKMTHIQKDQITFTSQEPHRKVTKTFRLVDEAPYSFTLDIQVDGSKDALVITSGIPEVEFVSGSFSPTLQYFNMVGKKDVVKKISLPKEESLVQDINPVWYSNSNGYFGIIANPVQSHLISKIEALNIPGERVPTRLSLIDAADNVYPVNDYPGYELSYPYKPTEETLSLRFFAGPFQVKSMEKADQFFASSGSDPQFAEAKLIRGWFTFITKYFAAFLNYFLQMFYNLTHSWGFSIILLTLLLRVILTPFQTWGSKSSAKLAALNPKIKAIEKKYAKNPKRMNMEMAMLYKTEGVSPFSAGCLQSLIQIPFLFGMFDVLKTSFDLRGASFIPGWINDLTAPDVVFSWGYHIWFLGSGLHILPFVSAFLQYLQQKMMTASQSVNSAQLTEQQKQMQSMGAILPLVFLFFFYSMPSGLNIYWIFNTLFAILQQWIITKKTSAKTTNNKNLVKN